MTRVRQFGPHRVDLDLLQRSGQPPAVAAGGDGVGMTIRQQLTGLVRAVYDGEVRGAWGYRYEERRWRKAEPRLAEWYNGRRREARHVLWAIRLHWRTY